MAANHLEQLVAEWYEYRGYFVRRNVLMGKRDKGGFECELDVVAFNPESKHLVHIEPSNDANSWDIRERRFAKKFEAGRKYIPSLFNGLDVPHEIEQIAVLGFASTRNRSSIGGAKIVLVSNLLREILAGIKNLRVASNAIPEQFPLLRTLQLVGEHRGAVIEELTIPRIPGV